MGKPVVGVSRTGCAPRHGVEPYASAGAVDEKLRVCQRCKETKVEDDFEGRRHVCKVCRAGYKRELRKHQFAQLRCIACGKEHNSGRRRCDTCRARKREDHARRSAARRERRKCAVCGVDLLGRQQKRCAECAAKSHDWRVSRRQEVKRHVIDHYGGVCACCSETCLSMLTIDHVAGDGSKHRRQLGRGRRGGFEFYQWLIRAGLPTGFAVLCFNCNYSKYLNSGVCEHLLPRGDA